VPLLVAQVSNLLYRRFSIGRRAQAQERWLWLVRTQVANLRYSRLQICATTLAAACAQVAMAAVLLLALPSPGATAQFDPATSAWLERQATIKTWSADLVQTRTFKSLTQPLVETGHVWFAAPDRFRWEIGQPAKTIAVRHAGEMLVIYPLLKRVERYPIEIGGTAPWREALALLEAGFPRSQKDLESRFRLVSQAVTNETCALTLEPKSSAARKLIKQITVVFGTNDSTLRATALQFADEATMRNDFSNAVLNPELDAALFSPAIPADYTVTEPTRER
jgi:outer membrane lipoprotein-sorting protein